MCFELLFYILFWLILKPVLAYPKITLQISKINHLLKLKDKEPRIIKTKKENI